MLFTSTSTPVITIVVMERALTLAVRAILYTLEDYVFFVGILAFVDLSGTSEHVPAKPSTSICG